MYLYRLSVPVELTRAVLLDYLAEMNRLAAKPKWYNAFTDNCTTTIRHHVQHVAAGNPWNWRILVNGYIDELGYERGTVDTSLPFSELRAKSNITQAAKAADQDPDFSKRIREGLPGERGGERESSATTLDRSPVQGDADFEDDTDAERTHAAW